MSNNYVVYHLHTEQSLIDSCTNYKLYVDKAIELGQKAIAFTEHGNIYNWIEKKQYCDKKGIKYIHGIECYLTEKLTDNEGNKVRDNYHTILLAKNYKGVQEINRLSYIATTQDHFYYKPRITFGEFMNISDNVIKISACIASPLEAWREGKIDSPLDNFIKHYDYLEVQPHTFDRQLEYNKWLVECSKQFNIPLIAGTDTHSLNQYKAECRTMLQYEKEIDFGDEDNCDLTYKDYNGICELFKNQNCLDEPTYLEAIENTNIMADSIEEFELDKGFKYPILYGEKDEEVLLNTLREKYLYKVQHGIIDKSKAKEYGDRVKEELAVFKKVGMIGFMLFMSEMNTWCWENNIPIGYGRGSCCGSTVAYIADIIDVDPIKWGTIFSRFCNIHRVELGDIDEDFSPDQRSLVYQYIIDRFGVENTGYILASGTISSKGTIDAIARGLNYKYLKEHGKNAEKPYPIPLTKQIKEEFERNEQQTREKYSELFYYYDGMINTVISQSQHPAGIIASPINLIDNYGGFINSDNQVVLPINMDECHDVNLVKYDILGLQNVQIIRDTCKLANIPYPKSYKINWEDKVVWEDIANDNRFIFQFESDYSSQCLKKFKPIMIDHLSIINAAIRPSGESYRDRLFNHEINKNPSEIIDNMLSYSNGFLVFQEQVTQFLQEICGFDGSDADQLRRAIGHKDTEALKNAMPKILDGYCSKSNKPRDVAEHEAKAFLQIIEDSSSYMFGRNHSTAYSMIGYTCGLLRHYYPLEFVTACLNNARNDDDVARGTSLAHDKGFTIKAPKFGHATNNYTCDKSTNTIYKGLGSIKGMQSIVANIMLQIAERNPQSFLDVLYLTNEIKIDNKKINTASMDILIDIGFFNSICTIQECKTTWVWFKMLSKKKTIKKEGTEQWLIDIAKNYCEKESNKQLTKIDSYGIIKEIINKIPIQDDNIYTLLSNQVKYLGYADTDEINIAPNVYIVQNFHKDKFSRYWLSIFQISSGTTNEYECDKKFASNQNVLEGDIVKIVFGSKPKYKKNENDKWIKTGEMKTYIKFWSRVK